VVRTSSEVWERCNGECEGSSGLGTGCVARHRRLALHPFCGEDGDDVDWAAYRTLVRYCVGDLGHEMLWCTNGLSEFWALTLDERKRLLEVAITEARALDPDVVIQACTSSMSAKDSLNLTLHAQEAGADIVYLQTPMMEVHGGEGVLNFFRYIADRTDIALGMFNSPLSGYVLTPAGGARIAAEIPAVCASKEGAFRPASPGCCTRWRRTCRSGSCDKSVYRAGWLRDGIVCSAQLGTAGYLFETPQRRIYTEYWNLIWDGKLIEAMDYAKVSGLDQFDLDIGSWFTSYPRRADYFTHWGGAFECAASVLGLPIGDHPHSRPPQAVLPDAAKVQIRGAYQRLGLLEG
jgi:4-hydroxy-tetrahydrodipicolinate synthase